MARNSPAKGRRTPPRRTPACSSAAAGAPSRVDEGFAEQFKMSFKRGTSFLRTKSINRQFEYSDDELDEEESNNSPTSGKSSFSVSRFFSRSSDGRQNDRDIGEEDSYEGKNPTEKAYHSKFADMRNRLGLTFIMRSKRGVGPSGPDTDAGQDTTSMKQFAGKRVSAVLAGVTTGQRKARDGRGRRQGLEFSQEGLMEIRDKGFSQSGLCPQMRKREADPPRPPSGEYQPASKNCIVLIPDQSWAIKPVKTVMTDLTTSLQQQGYHLTHLNFHPDRMEKAEEFILGMRAAVFLVRIPVLDMQVHDMLKRFRKEGVLGIGIDNPGMPMEHNGHTSVFKFPDKLFTNRLHCGFEERAEIREDGYRELPILIWGPPDSEEERNIIKTRVMPILTERCRSRRVRPLLCDMVLYSGMGNVNTMLRRMETARRTGAIFIFLAPTRLEKPKQSKAANVAVKDWLDHRDTPGEVRRPFDWLRNAPEDMTKLEYCLCHYLNLHTTPAFDATAEQVIKNESFAKSKQGSEEEDGSEDDFKFDTSDQRKTERKGKQQQNKTAEEAKQEVDEILANSKKSKTCLLMYLRDDAFWASVPDHAMHHLQDTDKYDIERLNALYSCVFAHPHTQVKHYSCQFGGMLDVVNNPSRIASKAVDEYSWGPFTVKGLEKFADMIVEDCWNRVVAEFPQDVGKDIVTRTEQEPEWTVRCSMPAYLNRNQEERALLKALKLGRPAIVVILNLPGTGATTVVTRVVREVRRHFSKVVGVKDFLISATFYVGLLEHRPSVSQVLASLCHQLRVELRIPKHYIPGDYNGLRRCLFKLLEIAISDPCCRVLLLVDGWTQVDNPLVHHWLPLQEELPPRVQLMVSANAQYIRRQKKVVEDAVTSYRSRFPDPPLEEMHAAEVWAQATEHQTLQLGLLQFMYPVAWFNATKIGQLSFNDRRNFFVSMGRIYGHEFTELQLMPVIGKTDSPYIIFNLLCSAEMMNKGSNLQHTELDHYPMDMTTAMMQKLRNSEARFPPVLIRNMLVPLAISRFGLSAKDMLTLLTWRMEDSDQDRGPEDALTPEILANLPNIVFPRLLKELESFINGAGYAPVGARYHLKNQNVHLGVMVRYAFDEKQRQEWNRTLAAYLIEHTAILHTAGGGQRVLEMLVGIGGRYANASPVLGENMMGLLSEENDDFLQRRNALTHAIAALPSYLLKAQMWEPLITLLMDPEFILAKYLMGLGHDLLADYDAFLFPPQEALHAREETNSQAELEAQMMGQKLDVKRGGLFDTSKAHLEAKKDALAGRPTNQELLLEWCLKYGQEHVIPELLAIRDFLWQTTEELARRPELLMQYLHNMPSGTIMNLMACSVPVSSASMQALLDSDESVRTKLLIWRHKPRDFAKCLRVIKAHDAAITHVSFGGDQFIVTASADQSIGVFNARSTDFMFYLKGEEHGHKHTVNAAKMLFLMSADEKEVVEHVVSISGDHTVKLWNCQEFNVKPKTQTDHAARVMAMGITAAMTHVITGDAAGVLHIWLLKDWKLAHTIVDPRGHKDAITHIDCAHDNIHFASASNDFTVALWAYRFDKPKEYALVTKITGHIAPVTCVKFAGEQVNLLITASRDRSIMIWNSENCARLSTIKGHMDAVTCVDFSPSGNMIVSGSDDTTCRLWSTTSGALLATLYGHETRVTSVCFAPDGHTIVSADMKGEVRIWGRVGCEGVASTGAVPTEGETPWLEGPEVLSLVVADPTDPEELANQEAAIPANKKVPRYAHHFLAITDLVYLPVYSFVVTSSEDCHLKVWDMKTGHMINQMKGASKPNRCLSAMPTQQYMLSACDDHNLLLWGMPGGNEEAMLMGHTKGVLSCAFSPTGLLAASASKDREVRIWNMEDLEGGVCRTTNTFTGHTAAVTCVNYDHSGEYLLTASNDYSVRLYSTESSALLAVFGDHAGPVTVAQYAANNAYVATACGDGVVRLWDARMHHFGQILSFSSCDSLPIAGLDLHPTNTNEILIAAGNTIQLYDIRKNAEPCEVAYFDGMSSITCCKFAPGASKDHDVICCGDSGGRLYTLDVIPTLNACKAVPLGGLIQY